jgi:predicted AlkP superfamily phosphohydrolase/phosphomutase
MLFRRKERKRACVVGLDGVPHWLLARLAQQGVMPRAAAILKGGTLTPLKAPLPPISSVSWSSFMTGANPGEHGIFGFTDIEPQRYRLRFPLFSDLAVPTFWDRLGKAGKRCAVMNQPATYPARAIPGALISGFVALDLPKSVVPPTYLEPLQDLGYRIDVDTKTARENPDGLLDDIDATHAIRRRAGAWLWDREEWDYFQFVVTGTDRLHHFLWHAVERAGDPRHTRAMAYYRAVDEVIGELWDRFHKGRPADREGEGFFLLSDHGFCALRQEVRLNAWLREAGYLGYRTDDPTTVADISDDTRAFALDPGRIYLNVKGRFGRGNVQAAEAPALRAEIAAKLRDLRFAGEPVVRQVFTREEAYHGPRTDLGPDLILLAHNGFDIKGTTKAKEVFGATHFQGMHTWDDALVWSALPVKADPEIVDLASVIERWVVG